MNGSVYIVSTGARTPLGLQSAPSAAAVRAGISAARLHPFMVDQAGDLMPAALDCELDPAISGPRRLVLLAESALREACEAVADFDVAKFSVPMYLGLSEIRPGFTHADTAQVQSALARQEGLPFPIGEVRFIAEGHAAGMSAFAVASEEVRKGAIDACLVGGVASYFDPATLEWLDNGRQLVGSTSRSGFVPGEASAFCLLLSARACDKLGIDPLARVLGAAIGRETKLIKSAEMCLGQGLSAVVHQCVSQSIEADERINDLIGDLNGERYRSEEWGFVCLRQGRHFNDPSAFLSPADCWGDVNAASGTLFAMLACQSFARGYASGPRTMLWTGSESGLRAVAVLESPTALNG